MAARIIELLLCWERVWVDGAKRGGEEEEKGKKRGRKGGGGGEIVRGFCRDVSLPRPPFLSRFQRRKKEL